jgi:hypothetical protein
MTFGRGRFDGSVPNNPLHLTAGVTFEAEVMGVSARRR